MENQRKIFQWCDCRETDRKAHGGGMSGEHLYFKNFVLIVMPDGLSIGHFYILRIG